jgi:hypothetical protein
MPFILSIQIQDTFQHLREKSGMPQPVVGLNGNGGLVAEAPMVFFLRRAPTTVRNSSLNGLFLLQTWQRLHI